MSVWGKLKENLASEKEKLSGKSFRDKVWYIWEYYKFVILGTVIGVALIVSIGSAIYKNRFDTALSCVIINGRLTSEKADPSLYFDPGFREYAGIDENSVISPDYSVSLSFEDNSTTEYGYAQLAKITAMVTGKDLDVMISDEDVISHYGSVSAFLDLRTILPPDLLPQMEDLFYYAETEDGQTIPCGIRIGGTSFQEKTGLSIEEPIFAIVGNSTHTDTCISLLRYIFEK